MELSSDVGGIEFLSKGHRGPVLLRPKEVVDPFSWLEESRQRIEEILTTCGAVVLRDLGLSSVSDFNRAVQIFSSDLLEYVHRSTPRSRVGGNLYTATEYPADRAIPLHNENSYTDSWPSRIYFYCAVAAEEGGETPTADSRSVYRMIDPTVREKFERTGVLYVRNFTDGIDLSWQEVFQTSDRAAVNAYCSQHGIDVEWGTGSPILRTRQHCQAALDHPRTGERVWFNQAHLFHTSALAAEEELSLIDALGVENVPRNAFYGNGDPIEIEVLAHIRGVYEQEKVVTPWQRNDVMILDNLLFAHGRNPYRGSRKIVVAMS
ncbi:TauD/TfdA family dioxygenase [[Kitasatospora] papulosa]|uniref:TauD/TfdA family dioxygenase n=1 Tax=[Kitasatospora] papulosa TaxID=1464011 RepID=UPI002E31A4FF|nr:TauD/TfdA family dioxygenase [[Kitasatospora] papulosa]